MLKKAGIIATVATTGVLALSGLAYAGEESGNLSNDCEFENTGGDVTQVQEGGNSLAGLIETFIGTATNLTTQTDTLNCTNLNVEDIIDQDSNNETETVDKTKIVDSFNTED